MEASVRTDEVLRIGALEIRPDDGMLIAGGRTVALSVRELELLAALARHPGRIVRRERLYELVWGGELRAGDRSVDVYVRKLRVKLAHALPGWRFIHTHVGFGYRLDPERASPAFHEQDTRR